MGIYFQAFGAPVPKQSFVYTRNGGGFIAPRVKNWQTVVALAAKEATAQVPAWQPYQGAVEVTLIFTLPTKRRVDLDNLSKNVCDAMRGIVYADDSQIVHLCIRKQYSNPPGVAVVIREDGEE